MAKRKVSIETVFADFERLSLDDQQALVAKLPYWTISHHPVLKRKLQEEMKRRTELDRDDANFVFGLVDRLKARIPRKRGKPTLNAVVLRLADEGLSDGKIMLHDDVKAENGGRPMERSAVQSIRRRHGRTKRR